MRQLLLPGALAAGQRVVISGDDYHYLATVLRLRAGDRLPVLDEAGGRWTLELLGDDGSRLLTRVDAPPDAPAPGPAVTVYQAIPKGRRFDESIRALVQAGVSRIRPVVTERTVVRPSEGSGRTERWRRIAREAVQQSGAARAAEIAEPQPLRDVVAVPGGLSLVLHTEPLAQTSLHGYLGDTPDEIELVVGPEGGFSGGEIDSLRERGFEPLWLGPHVLRSENAALFVAAAVQILILERDHWQPATT